jgi:hypothetical protein
MGSNADARYPGAAQNLGFVLTAAQLLLVVYLISSDAPTSEDGIQKTSVEHWWNNGQGNQFNMDFQVWVRKRGKKVEEVVQQIPGKMMQLNFYLVEERNWQSFVNALLFEVRKYPSE